MSQILVMDLETFPCPVMGKRVYGTEDPAAIRTARLAETKDKTDFMKPPFWQVVGLGMVGMNTTTGVVKAESWAGPAERDLIATFHAALANGPTLVTWHGREFDIPVVKYRGLFHGMSLHHLHQTKNIRTEDSYRHRYGSRHVDLEDEMRDYGASDKCKLSEVCALLNVPCKTLGGGKEVEAQFIAGDYDGIKKYVLEDAIALARVFLRWRASQNWLGVELVDALDRRCAEAYEQLVPQQLSLTPET